MSLMNLKRWGEVSKNLRKRVLNRDKHRCALCWRKYGLDVHHHYSFSSPRKSPYINTNEDDLITLCDSCHAKIQTCDHKSPIYQLVNEIMSMKDKIIISSRCDK